MIQAILLAGGKGTRLAPLTDNLPKPLVPIHGRPMILYVLEHLKRAGITNIAISVAHLGHMIEEYLGDGSAMGMQISYIREPEPMGTGGWMRLIDWDALAPEFLVANADNLFWIDVPAFLARHRETGAAASIAAIELPSETILNYELLKSSDDGRQLVDYIDRSRSAEYLQGRSTGFINSGWYVMTPAVQSVVPETAPISHETHVWPSLVQNGHVLGFYHGTEPWFDSGTHERLARVAAFLVEHPEYVSRNVS